MEIDELENKVKELEEKLSKKSEYNKYGYGNCGLCGGALIWQCDYDAEDMGYERAGIVSMATCSKCGAEVQTTRLEGDEEDE